jgi:hypothetical protein
MMVAGRLMDSVALEIVRRVKAQKFVIPAKAGIQYAAALVIKPRWLWNTGSPAFAGDDSFEALTPPA